MQTATTHERPAPPDERRRRTRLVSSTIGWLLPAAGDNSDSWEVRVQDVSRHGVGFCTSLPMHQGDVHRIRIGMGPLELARRMRVVSCRPSDARTFTVGAEFC